MLRQALAACRRSADSPHSALATQLHELLQLAAPSCCECRHRRSYAAESTITPHPEVNPAPSERVVSLVDGVENLSVKELVWFNKLLQERLGITDAELGIGVPMAQAAPAPVAGADAAAAPAEEAAPEKTEFAVVIEGYEASAKIKIIKEVRALLPGLGLKEGKEMVCTTLRLQCTASCVLKSRR